MPNTINPFRATLYATSLLGYAGSVMLSHIAQNPSHPEDAEHFLVHANMSLAAAGISGLAAFTFPWWSKYAFPENNITKSVDSPQQTTNPYAPLPVQNYLNSKDAANWLIQELSSPPPFLGSKVLGKLFSRHQYLNPMFEYTPDQMDDLFKTAWNKMTDDSKPLVTPNEAQEFFNTLLNNPDDKDANLLVTIYDNNITLLWLNKILNHLNEKTDEKEVYRCASLLLGMTQKKYLSEIIMTTDTNALRSAQNIYEKLSKQALE